MARAAAGAGTGAWSAYERWVLRQLERVAAANPAVALVGLPTALLHLAITAFGVLHRAPE
jgi:hypothetical protein